MGDVIIGYFLLLLYINRFTDNIVVKLLPIMYLIFLYIKYYHKNKFYKSKGKEAVPTSTRNLLLLLVLILCVGIIRNNNPDATLSSIVYTISAFLAFIIITIQVFKYIRNRYGANIEVYHKVIMLPFFLYAAINLIFWLLGIQGSSNEKYDIGKSVLLSSLGIGVDRIHFPFTNGINSYAALIGMTFTIELIYFFILKKKNLLSGVALLTYLGTLLLTDSRSALVYSAFIFLAILAIKNRRRIYFANLVPYLFILGPFILFTLLPILASTGQLTLFSRSDEDIATGNVRFIIWVYSVNEFLSFKQIHLYGYGLFGHYASGASLSWSSYFGYMANDELIHPHNSLLSMLFDYGYLGASVFIIFLTKQTKAVVRLWKWHRDLVLLYISFLFYFILISITESYFGFYYLNAIYLIFFFFLLPINISNNIEYEIQE